MKSLQNLSYKTLFTILFFSIAGIVFFLKIGGKTQKVSAAWWDEMWHYRKAISITNSSGNNQTNIQIKILENYDLSSLVSEGKLQSNLNDIRFTDINGNLLNYWIEDSTNTSVDIWGLIPSSPSTGANIFMYYGNNSANSMSHNTWMVDIGGIISYLNGYRIHAFKDSGTYYKYHNRSVEVLVIAGGGGGGYRHGAGGGAGGLIYQQSFNITENTTVIVGIGGSGSTSSTPNQQNGDNSTFLSLTAVGGGRGGQWDGLMTGSSGGSGGGSCSVTNVAGTFGQGNSGGNGYNGTSPYNWGGGGGSGQIGGNGTSTAHGNGGDGIYYGDKFGDIYGENGWFAGGGGGGGHDPTATQGYGGNGGGGDGGIPSVNSPGQDGIVNTGAGGGGASTSSGGNSRGGNGGSGIVLIRYPTTVITSSDVISDTPTNEEIGGGPIAYWKFDEGIGTTAYDSSSNQNNGLITGATWISDIGLSFDGSNDYITLTSPSLNNTIVWSINAKLKYINQNRQFEFFLGRNDTTTGKILLRHNGYISFRGVNGTYYDFATQSSEIHNIDSNISFVSDGTTIKLYINGVYKSSITPSSTSLSIDIIGNAWTDTVWQSIFFIDELKIYSYARTADQIKQDYNSRGSISGSSVNLGVRSNTAPSLKSSLVAHYKFDEGNGATVYDSSGNNKNGTLAIGSSSPTWNVNGYTNKALSFDGNDTITLANEIVSTSSIRTNGITYSAWIKPNSIDNIQKIVGQKPSSGYSDLASGGLDISSGKARMIAYDDGIAYKYATGNTALTPNKWYLITGIYNPSDQKIKIYVNGIFDGGETSIVTFNRLVSNDYNLIGSHNYASRFFNGLIDEVKIYNRALTPEEIKQDYNQGSVVQFGSTNQTIGSTTTSLEYCIPGDTSHCAPPIAEYKFDEGVGISTVDTSGNNINLGFSGSPTWIQGKIGKALSFNGSNNLTNNSKIISNGLGLSFGVWIKTSSIDSDANYAGNAAQNIIGDTDGGSVSFGFGVHGGKVRYTQYTASWQNITGNISVNDNLWHYINVTHSQSNGNIVIYVDGRQDITGNITYNGSNRFDVIARGFAGDHFTGQLDHLRIYNYPRTSAQIAYDYNRGAPIGHWKLDECQGNTAYDWSGIGNTGVINIGPSGTQNSLGTCAIGTSAAWTNGSTGKINSSIKLDGTDDKITFGNPTSLQVAGTKNFSVAAWIYSTQNKCGREGVDKSYNILCGTETNGGWVLGGRTGSLDFMVSDSTNLQSHRLSFSSQLNTWYHLVGVRNGNTLYLYVDGKLNKTGDITGFVIDDNKNFSIGGNITAWLWPGQIDDVRIYNYALTPEQIKQVYNGGSVNFR